MRNRQILLPMVMIGCLFTSLAAAQDAGGSGGVDREGQSGGGAGGSAPKRLPTHVACVGDSITAGVGAMTKSYVNWLIELLGKDVIVGGFGHAGACLTTNCRLPTSPYVDQPEYQGVTEWVVKAGEGAVVDVIIMLGTNDAAPQNWPDDGRAPVQYASDYGKLIDHFLSLPTHPTVYLVLPPAQYTPEPGMSASLQTGVIPVIWQVAEARGMPLIDVNTPTLQHPEWFPDGLHPNDAGHEVIAKVMHAALLNLPIPTPIPGTGGSPVGGGGGGGFGGSASAPTMETGGVPPAPSGGSAASGSPSASGGSARAASAPARGGCVVCATRGAAGGPAWLGVAFLGAVGLRRRALRRAG